MTARFQDCAGCGEPLPVTAEGAAPSGCPFCGRLTGGRSKRLTLFSGAAEVLAVRGEVELPASLTSRFEVDRVIGRGGAATVYRARSARSATLVAIKLLSAPDVPDLAGRFAREARLLATMESEHVVRLHEVCEAGPATALVMEYMEGGSLRDALAREGRVSLARALTWSAQILRGLADCHRAGVVHRDLKPENVLLTGDGRAKIADLGIARVFEGRDAQLTQPGTVLGTPLYMSPEQANGDPARTPADIYAAGLILHEMLGGRPAIPGRSFADVLAFHATGRLPPPPAGADLLPPGLVALMDRMLAPEPASRPHNAAELAAELDRFRPAPSAAAPVADAPAGAISDETLMMRAGRGDASAFTLLVERHARTIWRTAYRYTANRSDAEDLCQRAFERLWQGAARYQPTAPFMKYLRTVVTRLCLDHVDKQVALPLSTPPPQADPLPTPGQHASRQETVRELRDAIRRLPPNQRLAVLLRYDQGLPLGQIAQCLETTPKAVERLLSRGREALAEWLGAPG